MAAKQYKISLDDHIHDTLRAIDPSLSVAIKIVLAGYAGGRTMALPQNNNAYFPAPPQSTTSKQDTSAKLAKPDPDWVEAGYPRKPNEHYASYIKRVKYEKEHGPEAVRRWINESVRRELKEWGYVRPDGIEQYAEALGIAESEFNLLDWVAEEEIAALSPVRHSQRMLNGETPVPQATYAPRTILYTEEAIAVAKRRGVTLTNPPPEHFTTEQVKQINAEYTSRTLATHPESATDFSADDWE